MRERTAAVRGAVAFASRVFDGQPRIGRRRAVLLITHNRSTDDDVDGGDAIAALRGADVVLTALVVPQFSFSTASYARRHRDSRKKNCNLSSARPQGNRGVARAGCGRPGRRGDGRRDIQRRVERVLGNCPGPITQPLPHRLLRTGWGSPGTGANGSGHVDWGSVAAFPRRRRASSGAIENTVMLPNGKKWRLRQWARTPLSPRASSCRIGPRRQGFASPLRALDCSGPIRKTRCLRGEKGGARSGELRGALAHDKGEKGGARSGN